LCTGLYAVISRRSAVAIALTLATATVGVKGAQRLVPHLPPPPETSVYELMTLGPPPPTTCACIPNAFALPSYQPGWGYGSGPAVPFENAPVSDDQRRVNREWYAQEDQLIRRVSEEALNGNPNASFAVSTHMSLRTTVNGPDDRAEDEAMQWLNLAVRQGHPDAIRLLAHRHAVGRGVAQNYDAAAFLFDRAARLSDPISMTASGFLRAAGRGVRQDWTVAIRWWQYAEAKAPLSARFLGDAYACGAGVAEDHERALAFYKRVADVEPSASIQLGYMNARNCGKSDDKAAIAAFRRAADQGYPEAQIELSDLLRQGRGGEPNALEAYLWARLAERRLPSGDLKKRATDQAAAAARLMSSLEIKTQDDMVDAMLATGAKPVR
jgi:TPR repeat protein